MRSSAGFLLTPQQRQRLIAPTPLILPIQVANRESNDPNQQSSSTSASTAIPSSRIMTVAEKKSLFKEFSKAMRVAHKGFLEWDADSTDQFTVNPISGLAERYKHRSDGRIPMPPEESYNMEDACEIHIDELLTEEARLRFKGPLIPERMETTQSRIEDILAIAVREMELARLAGLEDQITRKNGKQSVTTKIKGAAGRKGIPHKIVPEEVKIEEVSSERSSLHNTMRNVIQNSRYRFRGYWSESPDLSAESQECSTSMQQPKVEEPEVEETRSKELKTVEQKIEEPKAEEPEAEKRKAEEVKAEELGVVDLKVEELKAEELKAEEPEEIMIQTYPESAGREPTSSCGRGGRFPRRSTQSVATSSPEPTMKRPVEKAATTSPKSTVPQPMGEPPAKKRPARRSEADRLLSMDFGPKEGARVSETEPRRRSTREPTPVLTPPPRTRPVRASSIKHMDTDSSHWDRSRSSSVKRLSVQRSRLSSVISEKDSDELFVAPTAPPSRTPTGSRASSVTRTSARLLSRTRTPTRTDTESAFRVPSLPKKLINPPAPIKKAPEPMMQKEESPVSSVPDKSSTNSPALTADARDRSPESPIPALVPIDPSPPSQMFAMNMLRMETTSPAVQAPIEKEEVVEMEAPALQAEEPMEVDRHDNLDRDSSFEGPTVRAFLMTGGRIHNQINSSGNGSKRSVAVFPIGSCIGAPVRITSVNQPSQPEAELPRTRKKTSFPKNQNRRLIPRHYSPPRDEPDPVLWAIHQRMAAAAASASTPITPNAPNTLAGRRTPMDIQSKRSSLDYYDPQVIAQRLAALQKIPDPVLQRSQEIVRRNRQLQQASNRGDHHQNFDNDSQRIPQQFVPPMQRNQQHHAARQGSTSSQSPASSRHVMIAPRPIPGAPVSRISPVSGTITMGNLTNRQLQQFVIRQQSIAQNPPAPQGSSSRATSPPLTAQPSRPVMFDGSVIEKPKEPEYYNVPRYAMSDPVCPPGKGPNIAEWKVTDMMNWFATFIEPPHDNLFAILKKELIDGTVMEDFFVINKDIDKFNLPYGVLNKIQRNIKLAVNEYNRYDYNEKIKDYQRRLLAAEEQQRINN
ncbi:unnamed protein product [Caenorhabditis sp. 36 PRJEB53466]|nr:unnamed protein product [Caenorhabditis sp. 36 PRJEB53466]